MVQIFRMSGIGYVGDRGAVAFAFSSERIDCSPALMPDVGDPASVLLDDNRQKRAAPLQVAVADESHVPGIGALVVLRGLRGCDKPRHCKHQRPCEYR